MTSDYLASWARARMAQATKKIIKFPTCTMEPLEPLGPVLKFDRVEYWKNRVEWREGAVETLDEDEGEKK